MKISKFFCAVAITAFALSCAKDPAVEPVNEDGKVKMSISALFDGQTKTALATGNKVNWLAEDKIGVYDGVGTALNVFNNTSGAGETATFAGTVSSGAVQSDFLAIYPSTSDGYDASDGTFMIELPQSQAGVNGSFDTDLSIAIGKCSDGSFKFRNVCGLIKFEIGSEDVTSVYLMGNNDESFAGFSLVNAESLEVTKADKAYVEVLPSNGRTVFEPGSYYMVIYPTVFSKGFSLEVTYESRTSITSERTTSKSVNVKRNTIMNLGRIDEDSESGADSLAPGDYYIFGALSNSYVPMTSDISNHKFGNGVGVDNLPSRIEESDPKCVWSFSVENGKYKILNRATETFIFFDKADTQYAGLNETGDLFSVEPSSDAGYRLKCEGADVISNREYLRVRNGSFGFYLNTQSGSSDVFYLVPTDYIPSPVVTDISPASGTLKYNEFGESKAKTYKVLTRYSKSISISLSGDYSSYFELSGNTVDVDESGEATFSVYPISANDSYEESRTVTINVTPVDESVIGAVSTANLTQIRRPLPTIECTSLPDIDYNVTDSQVSVINTTNAASIEILSGAGTSDSWYDTSLSALDSEGQASLTITPKSANNSEDARIATVVVKVSDGVKDVTASVSLKQYPKAELVQKTYVHTFKSGELSKNGGDVTLSNLIWASAKTGFLSFDNSKGIQIGSGSNANSSWTISTSAIPGRISKIIVNASMASKASAKISISVNGIDTNISSTSLTTSATDYVANVDPKQSGEILISYSQTTQRALYIKSITVEYEEEVAE